MLSDNNTTFTTEFNTNNTAGKVTFNNSAVVDFITNEAYKTLRTNILFCGANIKTIVITSSRENEGKSTVSAELAKSLAETGKKTLLIDADMRKSVMLRKYQKSSSFYGLSEFLSQQVGLERILYNTQQENFDVIFSGHYPPNPVELLSNEKFQFLIDQTRTFYDYIIIDSPPLGSVIDSAVIASKCDGAIIVITPYKISKGEVLNVKEQITKSGCKILGVILNDIDSKHSRYYKKNYKYYEYKNK